MAQRLPVHPNNPPERQIQIILDSLRSGGVIVYPTDTLYGLGCDMLQPDAIARINQIKRIDGGKIPLSFICASLSDMSQYTRSISTPLFRMLREYLPGPFTFILPASKLVPKILKSKKETIGLRVPEHPVAQMLVRELGRPLLGVSLPDDVVEEYTDPELIFEKYKKQVDIVIDSGIGGIDPSTVIDCTGPEPLLIRQGKGVWNG